MNTKKEIHEAADIINECIHKYNEIMPPEEYLRLRGLVDDDMLLYLGCLLVKQPTKTFYELPYKFIEDEKVDAVCLLYASDEK